MSQKRLKLSFAYCNIEIIVSAGIFCVSGAFIFASNLTKLKKKIRPIYVKMGIIFNITAAAQTETELSVSPEE